jgi:hypothetical protein
LLGKRKVPSKENLKEKKIYKRKENGFGRERENPPQHEVGKWLGRTESQT